MRSNDQSNARPMPTDMRCEEDAHCEDGINSKEAANCEDGICDVSF